MEKILAIIPARAGSKGIKNKNVRLVDGKPLINYTIETAIKSNLVTDIVVSSDSIEVLEIARKYQQVIIHKRNTQLASDKSPIIDTIIDVINFLESEFKYVILLQPTSPLRTGNEIDNAINLMKKNFNANSLISVVQMNDIHPARMYWLNNNLTLNPIMREFSEVRRQEIPPAYYRNGAIYISKVKSLLTNNSIMSTPSIAYEMPSKYLLNIDEERDLIIAESLIKEWKKENSIIE